MKDLIVIVGPTGVGKTKLSIRIAKELNGEIISADSMQIYRGMDIGTAKATELEKEEIEHHLMDIINPNDDFSVSDFRNKAYEKIDVILSKGKQPIVAGGTGLYINSLVYKLEFTEAKGNLDIRKKYESMSNTELIKILKKIDSSSVDRIENNDKKRLIRAIEIFELTGKPMSEQYNNFRKENSDFNLIYIGLNMDREKLYNRINIRVDRMMDDGLIDEVDSLLSSGFCSELNAMKAIGYKEVIDYKEGNITYEEMIEILKRNSRRYAKRQLTWFRKDKRIKWYNIDEYDTEEELFIDVLDYCKMKGNMTK